MRDMKIIAIDPGAKGGIAILFNDTTLTLCTVLDMPDLDTREGLCKLGDLLVSHSTTSPVEVVLEVQRSRGGNSAKSTWNHARHYGKVEALLSMYIPSEVPIIQLEPVVWMRRVKEEVGDPEVPCLDITKARTWTLAQSLFPDAPLLGPRGRKKDGIADAICLGWYHSLCDTR